jgi:hypothetical protein
LRKNVGVKTGVSGYEMMILCWRNSNWIGNFGLLILFLQLTVLGRIFTVFSISRNASSKHGEVDLFVSSAFILSSKMTKSCSEAWFKGYVDAEMFIFHPVTCLRSIASYRMTQLRHIVQCFAGKGNFRSPPGRSELWGGGADS